MIILPTATIKFSRLWYFFNFRRYGSNFLFSMLWDHLFIFDAMGPKIYFRRYEYEPFSFNTAIRHPPTF